MHRYLVLFTTPVPGGGWNPAFSDAWAVVIAPDGTEGATMPYGWNPLAINGIDVHEIKYIIPLGEGCPPQIISGEYDDDVPAIGDGEVVLVNDATMSAPTENEEE